MHIGFVWMLIYVKSFSRQLNEIIQQQGYGSAMVALFKAQISKTRNVVNLL